MKWLLALISLLYFIGCADTKYYNPDAEKYLASLNDVTTDGVYSGAQWAFSREPMKIESGTYYLDDGDSAFIYYAEYYIDYYQHDRIYFPWNNKKDLYNSYQFYKLKYYDGNEEMWMRVTLKDYGMPGINKCYFKFNDEEIVVDDIVLFEKIDYEDSRRVGETINVKIDKQLADKLFEEPEIKMVFKGNRKYEFSFEGTEVLKLYIASLINL
jgi:hypothetical protein